MFYMSKHKAHDRACLLLTCFRTSTFCEEDGGTGGNDGDGGNAGYGCDFRDGEW